MSPSRYQHGFTLLEGLAALTVLVSLLVLGAHYVQQRLEETLYQQAANQLRQVTAETERYVRRHHNALLERHDELLRQFNNNHPCRHFSTPTPKLLEECFHWQQLTIKLIEEIEKQKKLLELLGDTNIYQQNYAVFFNVHIPHGSHPAPKNSNSNPPSRQLKVLVLTTDGQSLPDLTLHRIARQLKGAGGYIATHDPTVIMGAQGGWSVNLPTKEQLEPEPRRKGQPARLPPLLKAAASGHLAMLSSPNADENLQSSALHNLLHRHGVAKEPELNQMETDLSMQHHEITFNNGATIGPKKMALQHDGRSIELQWNGNTPEILVKDGDTNSVTLHPESVKVSMGKQQTTASWRSPVAHYSGSELHARWNKVPYYEVTRIGDAHLQEFADSVCASATIDKPSEAIGRLFMVGQEQREETRLYLCLGTGPVIIQQFPRPSEDKEAHWPTKGKGAAAQRGSLPKATPRLGNKGK